MANVRSQQPDNSRPSRRPARSSAARALGLEPVPWERMLEETPKAYAAFRVFLEQGLQRSYVATARTLGKHESQLRRWAGPFRWKERAYAWDLAQSRELELILRQEQKQGVRRRIRQLEQIERIAMAGIGRLVIRDRETGEAQLSPLLTPAMAVKLYELVLKIYRSLPEIRTPDVPTTDIAEQMITSADPELNEIIAVIRQRLQSQGEKDHDDNTN